MNFFNFFLFFKKFLEVKVTLRMLDMFLSQDSIWHTRIFRAIKLMVARLLPLFFFFSKTVFS